MIAEHVGVGHQLVGELRAQLVAATSSQPRKGRDGKARATSTDKRKQGQQERRTREAVSKEADPQQDATTGAKAAPW